MKNQYIEGLGQFCKFKEGRGLGKKEVGGVLEGGWGLIPQCTICVPLTQNGGILTWLKLSGRPHKP